MNNPDVSVFQSFWTSLSRGRAKRIQLADVDYGSRSGDIHQGAGVFVSAVLVGNESEGKDLVTRSHARMSAFILRDLTSSADDTFAS
jgi:hypothetical protein